jgi:hypothetical protein
MNVFLLFPSLLFLFFLKFALPVDLSQNVPIQALTVTSFIPWIESALSIQWVLQYISLFEISIAGYSKI